MSSLIVELAESGKNTNNFDNGDYKTTIAPQLLEKGDQVVLKSAFVDSIQANPNTIRQITVDETTPGTGKCDIQVDFGYYYLDWGSVQETNASPSKIFKKYQNQDTNPVTASSYAHVARTGKPYVLNYPLSDPQTNIKYLDKFTVQFNPPSSSGRRGKNEIFQYNLLVSYPDWNETESQVETRLFGFSIQATQHYLNTYVPNNHEATIDANWIASANAAGILVGFTDPNYQNQPMPPFPTMPLRVHAGVDEQSVFTRIDTGDNKRKIENEYDNIVAGSSTFSVVPAGDISYKLYTQSIKFQIDAKTYEAVDLASLISEKMTDLNAGGSALITNDYILANNPLIKTVRQLMKNDDGSNYFSNTEPPTFFGRDDDGAYASFQFTTSLNGDTPIDGNGAGLTQNYILGSSDFALTYDEQHDKMVFLQYHNHLYSNTEAGGGLPQVRVLQNSKSINTANRVGGVFLTGLSPRQLWYGPDSSFKFDDSLLAQVKTLKGGQTAGNNIDPTGSSAKFDFVDLVEGVNCTADELGIDTFIRKQRTVITPAAGATPAVLSSAFDTVLPFTPSALTDQTGEFSSVSTNTINIRSAATLADTNDVNKIKKAGPYFKLEVDMPSINQKLIGSTTNSKVQSIISRFYQTGTYTSSYNEGSIPYVYQGDQPVMLSDFRVRILDDTGNIAKQLGNTSTIFMEIIKANPN